jgi:hypothetical protein
MKYGNIDYTNNLQEIYSARDNLTAVTKLTKGSINMVNGGYNTNMGTRGQTSEVLLGFRVP